MSSGVANAQVIDLITFDSKADTVVLIMVETRPWDGSGERKAQVEAKVNTYVAYAREGQLVRQYPQVKGKPVRIQLDCSAELDETTAVFLGGLSAALASRGFEFRVNVLPC